MWLVADMIVSALDVSCEYHSTKLLALLCSHLYDKLAHVLLYVLLSGIPDSLVFCLVSLRSLSTLFCRQEHDYPCNRQP